MYITQFGKCRAFYSIESEYADSLKLFRDEDGNMEDGQVHGPFQLWNSQLVSGNEHGVDIEFKIPGIKLLTRWVGML